MLNKKAVVLLSGGLDSAVTLYFARSKGFDCHCLAFDYGQRHHRELQAAQKISRLTDSPLKIIKIVLPWGGSALLDDKIKLPSSKHPSSRVIPSTYVPGRNIIFLSFALSFAEAIGARGIFIGAHAQDYSGYPDCRPEFYRAFKKVISTGTKAGVQHKGIEITTPLINKTKAEIIRLGNKLGVPFELTWSCYQGGKKPCGRCDSCYFRNKGFREAGIAQK
ncbi:MAG: 7-cyano-7-deazaguanine synthase QueC [Candidatus Omnitrophota bacterium]|nr:7-cyano-7-deazaguanine synthase QueC [Candidatus Omnitrophota bacterium]